MSRRRKLPRRPRPRTAFSPGREARAILESRLEERPDDLDLLASVVATRASEGDLDGLAPLCRRLLRHSPGLEWVRWMLGASYAHERRLALAFREFQACRGLVHTPLTQQWQPMAVATNEVLPLHQQQRGFPAGPEGLRLLTLMEEAEICVLEDDPSGFRQRLEEVLSCLPDNPACLQRLAAVNWSLGTVEEIEAAVQRLLRVDPADSVGLEMQVRLLLLQGREDEALTVARVLGGLEVTDPLRWLHKARAWTLVGEFRRVLECVDRLAGEHVPVHLRAEGMHLAGVACLELGDEPSARRHWRHCLELEPGQAEATSNLGDLDRPLPLREGTWAFGMDYRIPSSILRSLGRAIRGEQDLSLPGLGPVLRILLEHGGSAGHFLVVNLARRCDHPVVMAELHRHALACHGPDRCRIESALLATEKGALPAGRTRMWLEGAWNEVHLVACRIRRELRLPPSVVPLVHRFEAMIGRDDFRGAEKIVRKALELTPGSGHLEVLLAGALEAQGRSSEAEVLLTRAMATQPATVPAWNWMALRHALGGRLEEAARCLDHVAAQPALTPPELHGYALARSAEAMHLGRAEDARAWERLSRWAGPLSPPGYETEATAPPAVAGVC